MARMQTYIGYQLGLLFDGGWCWCSKSGFTNNARIKAGIRKVDWPPNSPDFNPIERIWAIMKKRILRRRGTERITTVTDMRRDLVEECGKITIEEINTEIEKLPAIMGRCIAVNRGNNFHAYLLLYLS